MPPGELGYGPFEVDAAKAHPRHVDEDELAVGQLPDQGQWQVAVGADDDRQVRVAHEAEDAALDRAVARLAGASGTAVLVQAAVVGVTAVDRLGAAAAGCPGPVRQASPGSDVVVSEGTVEGALRSIGVADENRAALIVGQPARVTASLLMSQGLVDVPTHLVVGGGDLYLVDTRQGTYVLARSTGDGPADDGYVMLPPSVANLWADAMARNRGWLWPVASPADRVASGSYLFAGNDSGIVARATCGGPSGSCALSLGDAGPVGESGGRWIPAERVLLYASSF
jgi:hypothetical protein